MGNRRGFTLIELMLAIAFISMLLLAIAAVGIQVGRIYTRGIVLRDVNQAGREISDTLRRDFLQANQRKIVTDAVRVPDNNNWVSGRMCLGSYSYVWNNPKHLDNPGMLGDSSLFRVDGRSVTMVRVVDPDGGLCKRSASGTYSNSETSTKVTHLLKPIQDGDGAIGIHGLSVKKVAPSSAVDNSEEALYRLVMTIGTSKMSELNHAGCRPPADGESNAEFCAINNFEMIVRTNG